MTLASMERVAMENVFASQIGPVPSARLRIVKEAAFTANVEKVACVNVSPGGVATTAPFRVICTTMGTFCCLSIKPSIF